MEGLVIWQAGTQTSFTVQQNNLLSFVREYQDVRVSVIGGNLVFQGYTSQKQPVLFIPTEEGTKHDQEG